MTTRGLFRVCHLDDTSNIRVGCVEVGEWSWEPVATGFPTSSGHTEADSPRGRTPSARPICV